ncbi:hypothetical protein HanRHA438_Chr14g0675481 [Helianthus annuus]|nr:hypothetical protein HanRHA438_Chr14g0675481 [Helianthus annuus]
MKFEDIMEFEGIGNPIIAKCPKKHSIDVEIYTQTNKHSKEKHQVDESHATNQHFQYVVQPIMKKM